MLLESSYENRMLAMLPLKTPPVAIAMIAYTVSTLCHDHDLWLKLPGHELNLLCFNSHEGDI